jgi:hypothetical protein
VLSERERPRPGVGSGRRSLKQWAALTKPAQNDVEQTPEQPAPLAPDARNPGHISYEPLTGPVTVTAPAGPTRLGPAVTLAPRAAHAGRARYVVAAVLAVFGIALGSGLLSGGGETSPGAVVMPKPSVTRVPASAIRRVAPARANHRPRHAAATQGRH